jgi:hypothetical protein
MRRKRSAVFVMMCTLFALILAACGGGGGTSDNGNSGIGNTMTVSINGAAPITYTEGAINGNGYYDPDMEADIYPDTGRTILILSSGVTGGPTPPVTLINIVTKGHAIGAYPVDGDGTGPTLTTYISYKDNAEYYDSIISSGTVTIDKIGNVGDPVTGSFRTVVALRSSPTQTHGISGTFNIKRAH